MSLDFDESRGFAARGGEPTKGHKAMENTMVRLIFKDEHGIRHRHTRYGQVDMVAPLYYSANTKMPEIFWVYFIVMKAWASAEPAKCFEVRDEFWASNVPQDIQLYNMLLGE